MTFEIDTVDTFCLKRRLPVLEDLGFTFIPSPYPGVYDKHAIGTVTITLDSLEALLELSVRVGEELVIMPAGDKPGALPRIEIYDGYRE